MEKRVSYIIAVINEFAQAHTLKSVFFPCQSELFVRKAAFAAHDERARAVYTAEIYFAPRCKFAEKELVFKVLCGL